MLAREGMKWGDNTQYIFLIWLSVFSWEVDSLEDLWFEFSYEIEKLEMVSDYQEERGVLSLLPLGEALVSWKNSDVICGYQNLLYQAPRLVLY